MNVRGIIGDKGTGKTLAMVWFLNEFHKQGYKKIFSNLKSLKIPDAKRITLDMILDPKNRELLRGSIIGIDELYRLIDARMTMVELWSHIDFSYFVLQIRKLDAELIYTSQQLGLFDTRVRQNTDYIYECNGLKSGIFKDGEIVGVRTLDGTINNFPYHPDKEKIIGCINMTQTNLMKIMEPEKKKRVWVNDALLNLYDTKEVVDPYEEERECTKHKLSKTTRQKIRRRDKYCQICKTKTSGIMEVHHIERKYDDPERNNPNNLILLCDKHHAIIDMLEDGIALSTYMKYYRDLKKYRKAIGIAEYGIKNRGGRMYLYNKRVSE